MVHVFISYADQNRAIADEVSGWLRADGHEPFLAHDLRNGVGAGENWKQRLYDELRKADVVIGVVTSFFVASNWCSAELGIADALGCRLMPLRAEAGVVHPLMQDLQIFVDRRLLLSDTDDDGQVWLTVAHEALLTEWPPLDTAIADITVALRTARTVERAAADWKAAGRPEHHLWDRERLAVTLTALGMAGDGGNRNPTAQPNVALDGDALAFLDATDRHVRARQEHDRRCVQPGLRPGRAHPRHRQRRPDRQVVGSQRPEPTPAARPTPDRPHRRSERPGVDVSPCPGGGSVRGDQAATCKGEQ